MILNIKSRFRFTFIQICCTMDGKEDLSMKEQLENIYNSAKNDIEKAMTISDIDDIRLKYLSRKGEFNSIKKGLKDLSDEDKRIIGAFANQITQDLEGMLKDKYEIFYQKELNEKLQKDRIDITLSGKYVPQGKVHRYSKILDFLLYLRNCHQKLKPNIITLTCLMFQKIILQEMYKTLSM